MNAIALSILTPSSPFLVTLHRLLCFICSRLETKADKSIVVFHMTFRNFLFSYPKNMDLFRGAGFLMLSTWVVKQVAQRATIAHLSPMCQGQILFKKSGDTDVLDAQGQLTP